MRFIARLPGGSIWSNLSLLGGVLVVALIPFVLGKCTREDQSEVKQAKVVFKAKMPEKKPASFPKTPSEAPTVTKLATSEEHASSIPAQGEVPESKEAAVPAPMKTAAVQKKGYYTVREGDSLIKIAGREDVYGDPAKWPSLFRLNMEKLTESQEEGDEIRYAKTLPEGLQLKFLTSDEVERNLTELTTKEWVVNAFSTQSLEKMGAMAIKLMRKGYHVYITTVTLKGEEWIRLRVGFYGSRSEAVARGKEIMALLGINDAWVARIGKEEMEAFGGY